MPFTSPAFLALLLITVPVYYLSSQERWQHGVLLASSFLFYWFAGIRDLALLLSVVGVNYAIARLAPPHSRLRVALAVAANLGTLAYFKYRNFFTETLTATTSAEVVSIPLGISFYIFQLIAYQVDIYRRKVAPERSLPRLLLYVLFFPHHQAGPIMRPAAFLPQFHGDKPIDWDQVGRGVCWTTYGLLLKVCADRVAELIDPIYLAGPDHMLQGWLAALGFTAQIYGDFAGYSSMAIGIGLMLGYQLDRNFNQPYLAADPSAFWQRWHITLSEWLRDYLYIPLGGNRVAVPRIYLNLLITMTLGGLWHGASWNFVIWGTLHGVLLGAFRLLPIARWNRALSWAICQFAVVLLWVPFRSHDFASTIRMWGAMFGRTGEFGPLFGWVTLLCCAAAFMIFHLFEEKVLATPASRAAYLARWNNRAPVVRGLVLGCTLLLAAVILKDGTTFIYFRF